MSPGEHPTCRYVNMAGDFFVGAVETMQMGGLSKMISGTPNDDRVNMGECSETNAKL